MAKWQKIIIKLGNKWGKIRSKSKNITRKSDMSLIILNVSEITATGTR